LSSPFGWAEADADKTRLILRAKKNVFAFIAFFSFEVLSGGVISAVATVLTGRSLAQLGKDQNRRKGRLNPEDPE
jgi:hypothetical protein